ncbi:MAG: hypothetical protein HVN35_08255 [Methanobacteriaceae archaeon]|nr:hypothetical protein [Methanobacteriaceae archaeon]
MIDTQLKTQLEKASLDLEKTQGVEGILIVASDGRILHHNLRVDVDINLFGPMSHVISNSSHRLLNSSGQGEMERVLVESSGGKALFLGLEKAHFIILMQDSANVGLVLVKAKRASKIINETTQDLELEVPTEIPEVTEGVSEEASEEITEKSEEISVKTDEISEEIVKTAKEIPEEISATHEVIREVEEAPEKIPEAISKLPVDETPVEEMAVKEESSSIGIKADETGEIKEEVAEEVVRKPPAEPVVESKEEISKEFISERVAESANFESPDVEHESESAEMGESKEVGLKVAQETIEPQTEIAKSELEIPEAEPESVKNELQTVDIKPETVETETDTVKEEVEEDKPSIPTVRPPISFPSLPEYVEVPDDPEKRSDLILEIYDKIFLAMSMGAAKIMGVAPARGLTKQFLPFEKCQRLLQNVDLKSNATIDFAQIKKNAAKIPLEEREEIFIRDFSRMIEIITENYGRVMGYEAFRGMVRSEFLAIKKSYGDAMDELKIKQNMHPEIAILFS